MESYSQVVLFFVRKNEPGGRRATRKHSANAHHRVILITRYTRFGWLPMGGKEDLMMQLVGRGILMVLKAVVWLVLAYFD